VVDYFDWRYAGNTADFVDWSVYIYGGAERAAMLLVREILARVRGPWTFIDAGANSGTITLAVCNRATAGLAFEPVSETRARLTRNLAINRIDHVAVYECALGAALGEADIHFPSGYANSGVASLLPTRHSRKDRMERVQVRPLDAFLTDVAPTHRLFVKVDVEGTEMELLEGARRLRDFDTLMLIETDRDEVLSLLRGWGFEGVSVENHYSRLRRYPLEARFGNHLLWNFAEAAVGSFVAQ